METTQNVNVATEATTPENTEATQRPVFDEIAEIT